jgi:cytochrome c-type biogenesis protein CcmE
MARRTEPVAASAPPAAVAPDAAAPQGPTGGPRGIRRPRVIVALAVIVGALAWIVFAALRNNLAYYRTPSDIARQGSAAVGESTRLGGLVEPGSVCARGRTVRFVVTDLRTNLTVVTSSAVPQLFAEGRGIVAEGSMGVDRVFHADDILVKHSDVYTPPKTGPIPQAPTPACG